MGIPMHDHEKPKKCPMFCRYFKEICHDGWVKSMGESQDGVRPKCNAWVGVFVVKKDAPTQICEVFDCKDQWESDLLQQVAQEVYQGAAATEQSRNLISGQEGSFRRMSIAIVAMARQNGVTLDKFSAIEKEISEREKKLLGGDRATHPGGQ